MSELTDDVCVPIDNITLLRALKRPSREALVDLVQHWTTGDTLGVCPPNLDPSSSEENQFLGPAPDLSTLANIYQQLLEAKATKKELLERLTEVDWINGLSMRQMADIELRDLTDRPSSMRWSAMRISKQRVDYDESYQGFAPSPNLSFVNLSLDDLRQGFRMELGSLYKTHIYSSHYAPLNLEIIRIMIAIGDCYVDDKAIVSADDDSVAFKCIWLAMRQGSEHIFVSPPSASQMPAQGHVESVIVGAIPGILATPTVRYILRQSQHQEPLPLEQLDRVVRGQTASELQLGG